MEARRFITGQVSVRAQTLSCSYCRSILHVKKIVEISVQPSLRMRHLSSTAYVGLHSQEDLETLFSDSEGDFFTRHP